MTSNTLLPGALVRRHLTRRTALKLMGLPVLTSLAAACGGSSETPAPATTQPTTGSTPVTSGTPLSTFVTPAAPASTDTPTAAAPSGDGPRPGGIMNL